MTQFLKDTTPIPNWLMTIVVVVIIGMFTTGWAKVDNIRTELSIEQTHRIYVVEKVTTIEKKIDKILVKLDQKEDK